MVNGNNDYKFIIDSSEDLVDNRTELQCVNDTDVFWIIFLSFKGVWIIFGAVLAFLTRNISEEYNNSKNIAYAVS